MEVWGGNLSLRDSDLIWVMCNRPHPGGLVSRLPAVCFFCVVIDPGCPPPIPIPQPPSGFPALVPSDWRNEANSSRLASPSFTSPGPRQLLTVGQLLQSSCRPSHTCCLWPSGTWKCSRDGWVNMDDGHGPGRASTTTLTLVGFHPSQHALPGASSVLAGWKTHNPTRHCNDRLCLYLHACDSCS